MKNVAENTNTNTVVEEEKAIKENRILNVRPDALRIEEGFNTRIDYGDIESLAQSIKANGVLVPLQGYKEGETFVITDGHRRFKAIQIAIKNGAKIEYVKCINSLKRSTEERLFDVVVTNDGKALNTLELGITFKRLLAYGYEPESIAARVGKTVQTVNAAIELANAPKRLQDAIINGLVSATLASETIRETKDSDKAAAILLDAIAENNGEKITKKAIKDTVAKESKVKKHIKKTVFNNEDETAKELTFDEKLALEDAEFEAEEAKRIKETFTRGQVERLIEKYKKAFAKSVVRILELEGDVAELVTDLEIDFEF